MELVARSVARSLPRGLDPMTPESVRRAVSDYRLVTVEQMKGKSHGVRVTRARHEAMWLIRETVRPGLSFPDIARLFGGRDHTSVIHAWRRIEALVDSDPGYRDDLLSIVEPARAEAA